MPGVAVEEIVESKVSPPEAVRPLLIRDVFGAFFLDPIPEDEGEKG